MRYNKIIKSILLIIPIFLITNCSNNSAMKPEDFKDKKPRLIIENIYQAMLKLGVFFKTGLEKLQDNFLLI